MFLLFVVGGHVTRGVFQEHCGLVVVGGALRCGLAVLVEAHFLFVDDAVHVVPRSTNQRAEL